MSTLHRERVLRARRSRNTQIALYRNELRKAAASRSACLAAAEESLRRIQQLLPGALQAGLPVAEAAELTALSRATVYRMLSDARQQQDLRGLASEFATALVGLTKSLGRRPLPADLQAYFHVPLEEVFELLMQLYRLLSVEAVALGPLALALLGDLIPGLDNPEKIVLNMLLFQRLSVEDVASSTQLSETRVLGWASLGLLRVLPELRARRGVAGK